MIQSIGRGALVALLVGAAAAKADPAAHEAAVRFGAREQIAQISLSPDGAKAAVIAPEAKGPGSVLLVVDLTTGDIKRITRSTGNPDRLRRCQWTTNTRLVCTVFMILDSNATATSFTRALAINSDGTGLKVLTPEINHRSLGIIQNGGGVIDLTGDGSDGSTLMTRTFVPENTTGTHVASDREGLGVDVVDTVTLKRRTIEPPKPSAVEYHSDGHGVVRVMGLRSHDDSRYDDARIAYYYRRKGEREWRPLSTVTTVASGGETGFDPYAVDRDGDAVYGFDNQNGHTALFRIALDGSLKKERVYGRDDVDVDELITIGRQRRVVGAAYATERRQTEFFDPDLAKLRKSLGNALAGERNLSFIDASADERKLLIFSGSDVDPGRYFVFDKADRHLAELLPVRPQLEKIKLATVKPITYKAADGTLIPGYLTLPPGSDGRDLPAIVMPHGGPGARDEWGFNWLAQFFAHRGFAVLQPNFRGSTGYGDAWFQKNGFQSWRTAIGDVNDAGRYLLSAGVAARGKLAIVGWSYGGYAALQSAVLDPDLYKAIVAIAPVTDLPLLREQSRDYSNFKLVSQFIGSGPHLREGSPAQNAARIKAPVLMFHGDADQNVAIGQSQLMASRLKAADKAVQLVEFKNLDHQLDDGDVRAQMLEKADDFLRSTLGL